MYLNKLQQDDIFVSNEITSLRSITRMESRRGLENAIISNGKIVNVVSNSYGHIPNELFFKKAEQMLIDADLKYHRRTINRNDRSFITDFIIEGENQFSLKNNNDSILPMLRFKHSYDGSEKISGHFGFYRKVCSNGLHVAETEIEFSIKHSKNNTHLIMPRLNLLFDKFLDNEFYTITKKFDKLKEIEIIDTKAFVRDINDPDTAKYYERFFEIVKKHTRSINKGYNLNFDTRVTQGEKEVAKTRVDAFYGLKQGEFIVFADGKDKKVQFKQHKIRQDLPPFDKIVESDLEDNFIKIHNKVKSIFKI